MQLDKTHVAIRERTFGDLMDLALRVIRGHAGPLVLCWLVGVVPLAMLNYWLLSPRLPVAELPDDSRWGYLWHLLLLSIWQIPLATAPMTLYLGQVLFLDKPSAREIARQFFSRLSQLVWLQVMLRGLLVAWGVYGFLFAMNEPGLILIEFLLMVEWFCLYILWPYLNEILLLERNPLRKSRGGTSTLGRAASMQSHSSGDLLGRWLLSLLIAVPLAIALWFALWTVRATLTFDNSNDATTYSVLLPIAIWVVIGYFTVVRFLCYLDLRIRTEGWEVELMMRAEGARLARQVA